jgi:hypothetical protein
MAKDSGKQPKTAVHDELIDAEGAIRRRAYEFYEEGGRQDGHQLDDWLRAEAEITRKNTRTAAA